MATKHSSPDADLPEQLKKLSLKDDYEIMLCNWNIMGTAPAGERKEVTTATFNHPFRDDGTSLRQSDIICVQEMSCNPQGENTITAYLPFASEYGVIQSQEQGSSISPPWNAIFFNKDKFNEIRPTPAYTSLYQGTKINCFEKAYEILEFKRQCYENIKRGGDDKINDAIKGRLAAENYEEAEKQRIYEEVLEECKTVKTTPEFHKKMARFHAPGSRETKHPRELLIHRMAIGLLKVNSMQNYYVVVVCIHNYSRNRGRENPPNHATLFFDFMAKLQCLLHERKNNFSIIIAGDFNYDIEQDTSLWELASGFRVPPYDMNALRGDLSKIDFVVVSKELVVDTRAHDLQIPSDVRDAFGKKNGLKEEKDITNHNPLSATIKIKHRELE